MERILQNKTILEVDDCPGWSNNISFCNIKIDKYAVWKYFIYKIKKMIYLQYKAKVQPETYEREKIYKDFDIYRRIM